ncbi:Isocitrate dehydrogenase [NAD] regulatory subunit 2, mitochondrial-like protein [Drosera capensis]
MSRQTLPLLKRLISAHSPPHHHHSSSFSSLRSRTLAPDTRIHGPVMTERNEERPEKETVNANEAWNINGGIRMSAMPLTPNIYGTLLVNAAGGIPGRSGLMPSGNVGAMYSTLAHDASTGPEQKKATPAASFRPLSPHLVVYKPQMGSICFTHESFCQLLFYSSKLVPITVEISALAFAYHVIYGIRHLWADFRGYHFEHQYESLTCTSRFGWSFVDDEDRSRSVFVPCLDQVGNLLQRAKVKEEN